MSSTVTQQQTDNLNLRPDIEAIIRSTSDEEVHSVCDSVSQKLGMDYFTACVVSSDNYNRPKYKIMSSCPDGWKRDYEKNKYLSVDPVVKHCSANVTPTLWSTDEEILDDMDLTAKEMMVKAHGYGLATGAATPLHDNRGNSAIFSLCSGNESDDMEAHIDQIMPHMVMFAAYVYEKVLELQGNNMLVDQNLLTSRERECLSWGADGKTAWEIANILNIAERTANFHLQNAMHKLGSVSKAHAIAKAITMGYIRPAFS
jgi:DNA-binding CsgD family transcriptional regulator